jgi:methionyl aminopeptidase
MSLRLPRLLQRLPSLEATLLHCQRRSASITPLVTQETLRKRWQADPTYRKISPPASVEWAMPRIPDHVPRPPYALTGERPEWKDMIACAYPVGPAEWYDEHLERGMRNAGRRTAECLAFAKSLVKPGITTRAIDRQVMEWAFSHRCYPSSLNYGRFPGSLCTSVNNVVAHGVPNE